jgi:predicted acetyltransferase
MTVWPAMPDDDPLPHLLQEPRMLRDTAREGILGRVVDLPRALTARPYGTAASVRFEVLDELCPWNAGRWSLETDGQASEVRRETGEPQLSMPVSTLALLLFGQVSATEAARMGRLDAHDPAALPLWDAVMRTRYRPFCGDGF